MSDQGAPVQGPPDAVGPPGTPDAAEQANQQQIDWENRYQNLQPEYTRATQENAALRQQQELYQQLLSTDDPDTQREIAEALGYRLEEEEEEPEYDLDEDPLEHYDERLSRLEESTQAREAAADEAAYAAEVRAIVDEQLDALPGLDKDDQDWVLAYAINALPITEEGLPDIGRAHEVFEERERVRQRAWASTKRAPRISPNGQPGTEVPNLDNRQERQDWMTRRLQDNAGEF